MSIVFAFFSFCVGWFLGFRSGCKFTAKEFYEYIDKKTFLQYKKQGVNHDTASNNGTK